MPDAAGPSRKAIASATSSVRAQRPGSAFGIAARFCGVSIAPGSTALTRTPSALSSAARASTSRRTPALDAAYAPRPEVACSPAAAPTATSEPAPAVRIGGSAARKTLSVVSTFSRNMSVQTSGTASAALAVANPPTVWATPSILPKRAITAATTASHAAPSKKSTPPRTSRSPSRSPPDPSLRSAAASRAPPRASTSTTALPRLPPAPVTR